MNIYDLATKIFPLVASWLSNEKVNFEPCKRYTKHKPHFWQFAFCCCSIAHQA